ncbi:MAG: hypothetical protein K6E97_04950 [Treponema sp.]|nr:hypothetical protein [Treponema sp.]
MEKINLENIITKVQAVSVIKIILKRFEGLLLYYDENKNRLVNFTFLAQILREYKRKNVPKALNNFVYKDELNSLGPNACRDFLVKLKPLSEKFRLNVTIPKGIIVYDVSEEELKDKYVRKVNKDCWKIYLDNTNSIKKVEYGIDKTKAQLIYSDGTISDEIIMTGEKYDKYGFAKKLLVAADMKVNEENNINLQNIMLDDGLFYVNKDKGWIEKERYFKEMTPEDFLTIQDYKDVTVKAVYDDNEGKLTFTYTAGGKTEELFVITASNNQKDREWPTASGKKTFVKTDQMRTTPPVNSYEVDYIPSKFPKGNWKITAFEENGAQEYGPYKIRTDAWRWVDVWEQYTDEYGELNWRKKKDKEGNIIKAKDAGLLIHGGGWSESDLDNKKGSNKYTDTTLGCIRISNLDVLLIVKVLDAYMSINKYISLEVI